MNSMIIKVAVSVAAVFLVVGLGVGGYFGRQIGRQAGYSSAREELQGLLDLAYPPPPKVMTRLSGTVRQVVGGTIQVDVNDPDDYLPHVDGSPRATELRRAKVSAQTEYVLVDYSQPDAQGNPARIAFELSDLKAGDRIVLESSESIREAKSFGVKKVLRSKF